MSAMQSRDMSAGRKIWALALSDVGQWVLVPAIMVAATGALSLIAP